jgi:vanillate/3-O-methylgallate O-demethylase
MSAHSPNITTSTIVDNPIDDLSWRSAVPVESLEEKLNRIGDPIAMLRNSQIGPYVFPDRSEYTNWRDEQEAWMSTAVLFDQSFHMTDVYFEGPDVRRLMSDFGVNSFENFGRNIAKQFVACNPDGYVIGDAVLFVLEEDKAVLVGRPAAGNWMAFNASSGSYDVTVTRDERAVDNKGARLTFRYQVQGPNALEILMKAADDALPEVKFFHLGEFTIEDVPVRALNHSMARAPGLEIIGPAADRERVLEALLSAGEGFGLRRGGARAYSTVAIESGWIPSPTPAIYSGDAMRPYRESLSGDGWEATLSIGGSYVPSSIEGYYQRPWDLGYGRLVKFDHDFLGREALERVAGDPHRQKVWLEWDDDAVIGVFRNIFGPGERAKYMDMPAAHYATLPFDSVLNRDRLVGLSTYPVYTANARRWFSLAMVDESEVEDGARLTVLWGEPDGGTGKPVVERHVQTEIPVTLSTSPPARAAE